MDMLGQSQELMTIYYQHASDADRHEAADTVGAWLREPIGRGASGRGRVNFGESSNCRAKLVARAHLEAPVRHRLTVGRAVLNSKWVYSQPSREAGAVEFRGERVRRWVEITLSRLGMVVRVLPHRQ